MHGNITVTDTTSGWDKEKRSLFNVLQEMSHGDLASVQLETVSFGEITPSWGFQVALVVKNPPANAGDLRDPGAIPGLGRSPGGEQGNPLQYSCLENPTDGGAWRATAHGVAKSQTRLK